MVPGDIIGGRFELEREAASGGMSRVFQARDRDTGARVAVKVIAGGASRDRFEREAELLAALAMPGIVRYIAHGAAYLVLEWLDGADLQRELSERGLTIEQSLVLGERVARTLAALHARDVCHRDVKPSNVIVVGGDPARATLLDFGIAHTLRPGEPATGSAVGTPAYMSPEQASGQRDIDGRADVFSLGCVLFTCLTGRPPFRGEGFATLLEPPRVHMFRPDVPAAVAELVARMMSRARDDRPNADEVARAVAACAPVPASRPQRLQPSFGGGEQRVLTLAAWQGSLADERARAIVATATMIAERDGIAFAAFAAHGNAMRQTTRVASLALRAGGAGTVVCTGRAAMLGGAPVGEVVERARRLTASAHGVMLDVATAELLEDRFTVERAGELVALTAELAYPPGARTLLARRAPCCGRDGELAALTALYDEVVAEASARIALVTGAAGCGKSRLVDALAAALRVRGEVEVVIERTEPHDAIDPAVVGERLQALASASARHPVVIVLEDLQWHHPSTAKLVGNLLRQLRDRPLLVVAAGRPEVRDIASALWADRGLYELGLGALSPKASAQIARAVLGDVDIAALVRTARGNPLVLEALMLAGSDAVLAALEPQLDRLDPGARRALRAASWFDASFSSDQLAMLLGESATEWLAVLEDHDFIHRSPTEFAFVDAIVRDAIRSTLTDDDRAIADDQARCGRPT